MDEKKDVDIHVQVCCKDLVASIKQGIVIINEGEFCLGKTQFKLKEPEKGTDTVIVKLIFCPWCGKLFKKLTDEINQKVKEADKKKEATQ